MFISLELSKPRISEIYQIIIYPTVLDKSGKQIKHYVEKIKIEYNSKKQQQKKLFREKKLVTFLFSQN